MQKLNAKILLAFIVLLLSVNFQVGFNRPESSRAKVTTADTENICQALGCRGGLRHCAQVNIPQEKNPVDRIYICTEARFYDVEKK